MRKAWVTIAVVAALLVPTTAVFAECAWVLWENGASVGKDTPADQSWSVVAAWPTYQACQPMQFTAAKDRAQRLRSVPRPPRRPTTDAPGLEVKVEGNQVLVVYTTGVANYTYLCLPATLDPRGPKGGTR